MSSGSDQSPKNTTRSVALAQERTRSHRLDRLRKSLEDRLVDAVPAIDALMAELGEGCPHDDLWQQLHSAATRDGMQPGVADAYHKCTAGPRMKRLSREARAAVLMHACDFFENVSRDEVAAESYLARVLDTVPGHADAFVRLERHVERSRDPVKLLELYAKVAGAPPRPAAVLANQALNNLLLLNAKRPLSEDSCKRLLALVPVAPRILDALEKHCCATERHRLACSLIEQALVESSMPESAVVQWRTRLLELYMGDAASPAEAMPHVEALLERDPTHAKALDTAKKLLGTRAVETRAAEALRNARRARA